MPVEWSASRRRYIRNGRAVPEKEIRKTVQVAIDSGKREVASLTQSLVDGKINSAQWSARMREEVRAAHRAVSMIANGGTLDASAAGKLGATLRAQYKYLDNFSNQLDNGTVALDARLVTRAQLYVQAARTTYENAVVHREARAGATLGLWVLSVAEHCAGCLGQARLGVQPLNSFPLIGSQECRVNCRCRIDVVGAKQPARRG